MSGDNRITIRMDKYLYNWLLNKTGGEEDSTTMSSVIRREVVRPAMFTVQAGGFKKIEDLLSTLNYKDFAHVYLSGKDRITVRFYKSELMFIGGLSRRLGIKKGPTIRALMVLKIKKLI